MPTLDEAVAAAVAALDHEWVSDTTGVFIEAQHLRVLLSNVTEQKPPRMDEADRQDLARRLAHALNYSYEATMGDYSQTSIDRAAADLWAVRQTVTLMGLTESDLVTRNDYGVFAPIQKEN